MAVRMYADYAPEEGSKMYRLVLYYEDPDGVWVPLIRGPFNNFASASGSLEHEIRSNPPDTKMVGHIESALVHWEAAEELF